MKTIDNSTILLQTSRIIIINNFGDMNKRISDKIRSLKCKIPFFLQLENNSQLYAANQQNRYILRDEVDKLKERKTIR